MGLPLRRKKRARVEVSMSDSMWFCLSAGTLIPSSLSPLVSFEEVVFRQNENLPGATGHYWRCFAKFAQTLEMLKVRLAWQSLLRRSLHLAWPKSGLLLIFKLLSSFELPWLGGLSFSVNEDLAGRRKTSLISLSVISTSNGFRISSPAP